MQHGSGGRSLERRSPLRWQPSTDIAESADSQLLVRRDAAGLEELYRRHSVVAYSVARRIVGPGHAEEAVQEAFVGLWRSAGAYDPAQGAVRGWLLGMVRNRSIDVLRRLAVHERQALHSQAWTERSTAESTEDIVERSERAATVRRTLEALSIDQRTVVELAYFGGLSQSEIARQLQIPLGTVKGRMRRALDLLREELTATALQPQ